MFNLGIVLSRIICKRCIVIKILAFYLFIVYDVTTIKSRDKVYIKKIRCCEMIITLYGMISYQFFNYSCTIEHARVIHQNKPPCRGLFSRI